MSHTPFPITWRLSSMVQMADLQQEHHREIEGLLENIRHLSRELRLQMLIIDNFIPQEYQVCVRACVCVYVCSYMRPCLRTISLVSDECLLIRMVGGSVDHSNLINPMCTCFMFFFFRRWLRTMSTGMKILASGSWWVTTPSKMSLWLFFCSLEHVWWQLKKKKKTCSHEHTL